MIEHTPEGWVLIGPEGRLLVPEQDDITPKLSMLFEAQCEGRRVIDTVKKFGFTKQRYYQLLHLFQEKGASALQNQKRGPKSNYRRTQENVRQVIRHRFLVYRFIKTHTYLIIKNDKCQNTKFKSNLNFISLRLIKMSKILIGVMHFEI
jgi:hypothetical protein